MCNKYRFLSALMAMILIISFLLSSVIFPVSATESTTKTTFVGTFTNSKSGECSIEYSFDPMWFFDNPEEFNPELCTTMGLLSVMAYGDGGSKIKVTSPKKKSYSGDKATEFISSLGFSSVEECKLSDHIFDTNTTYIYLANQKIEKDGEKATLLLVDIRGTKGWQEWISDLDFSLENNNHKGFSEASKKVTKKIDSYISDNKIDSKNIIYMFTGHSRGGGISNIISAQLIDDGQKCFTYTFACPATTKSDKANKYKSIFNIINDEDLITFLPSAFTRYGIDKGISAFSLFDADSKILSCGTGNSTISYLEDISWLQSAIDELNGIENLAASATFFVTQGITHKNDVWYAHTLPTYFAITNEIECKTIVVTPDNLTRKFGEEDPEFTYSIICRSDVSDILEGSLEREEGENVGTYDVSIGSLSVSNRDYEIVFKEGSTLTIIKADSPKAYTASSSFVFSEGTQGRAYFEVLSQLPDNCGETSTAINVEGDNIFTTAPEIIDGRLIYEIAPQDSFDNQKATIKVNISMENYEDVTFEYTVSLENEIVNNTTLIFIISIIALAVLLIAAVVVLIIVLRKKSK